MSESLPQFAALVSLLVRHSYFAGGVCRELNFEPDAESATLMRQYRLLLKATDAGFTLVAEILPGLPLTENLALRFNAFPGDPLFAFYTRELQELGTPLHCSDAVASTDGTLTPARAPATLLTTTVMNRLRAPALVIDLLLTPQDFQLSSRTVYVPARALTIQLHTRALHWKYFFFGDLARYDLHIEDTDPENPVGFSACDEVLVKSGKALISRAPLPMGQEPQQRLQLKDKNNPGKVLIKRLPNASMKKIGKSRSPSGSDGESVYVAEIYINQ